jgi:tetratricopeptide (TPR) repeat protein
VKLFSEEKASVLKRGTQNAEAYELYLKGRYHFALRTVDDLQKGLSYFEQALGADPEYALALVGISDLYNSCAKSLSVPATDVIPKAKSAARKALEIDPALSEAHASLADSLAIFDWNWEEAEREFKRAIELDPNLSFNHFTYGVSYLVPMGRMDEAIAEIKRAVELEPLSLIANSILAEVYLYARQYDKAVEQAREAYDLNPQYITSRFWLGHSLLAAGMSEEALEVSESSLKMMPAFPVYMYLAGQVYANTGRRKDAERVIEQIREPRKTTHVQPYSLARIYTALGDKEMAFAELEKALEQRDWWLPRLRVDPLMDPLREDPRFNEIVRRIGLPPIEKINS